MKRVYYFWRQYKVDILTLMIVPFMLVCISIFIKDHKAILAISLVTLFIELMVLLLLRSRMRDFYYIPFDKDKDSKDWIGGGKFERDGSERTFHITDSEGGFIFSNCLLWSNYKVNLRFKIAHHCLGVILRAVNLSNYVMLQIREDRIRPHVRVNGGWVVFEEDTDNFKFKANLSLDNWYQCLLVCEKEYIKIRLVDEREEEIFNRQWTIPRGDVPFEFKRKGDGNQTETFILRINLDYGSLGFRNCGPERALLRDFLVEKI